MPVALIVDDQDFIQAVLAAMLTRLGFESLAVGSGEAAIQLVRDTRVDLVFMDVMLPGINGCEACAIIKEIVPEVPVIGMSGFPDQAGDMPDIVAFLEKPFEIRTVECILRHLAL